MKNAKKTVKTVFPMGLIMASLVFFFNPNIQLVDLLPDLFGYVLLIMGLYYLADLNEAIGEARERFKKMLFVEVAKFIVFLMVFGGLVTPQEHSSFVLLASLTFCTIELLILIPATRSLFAGMLQLATKFGSDAVFATRPKALPLPPKAGFKNGKSKKKFEARVRGIEYKNARLRCALEKLQTLTLAFVVLKPIMALIPELSALSNTEYNDALVNYYDFISLFRGFGTVLFLPFAILWLIRTVTFLRRLQADTAFGEACLTHYRTEVAPHAELFIRRAIYTALSLIGLGMIFSLDFYIEYYNIIPDTLCAIFVIAGILLMKKYISNHRPVVWSAAGYGAMTLVSSALTIFFNQKYYFGAIYKNGGALAVYILECAATLMENLLFVWMLWYLMRAMGEMITRYSGYSVTSSTDPGSSERVRRVHIELKKTMYVFFTAAIVSGACGIAYDVLKPSVPYMWMIDFVVSVLYICLFYRSTWAIREQVEYKYMLT